MPHLALFGIRIVFLWTRGLSLDLRWKPATVNILPNACAYSTPQTRAAIKHASNMATHTASGRPGRPGIWELCAEHCMRGALHARATRVRVWRGGAQTAMQSEKEKLRWSFERERGVTARRSCVDTFAATHLRRHKAGSRAWVHEVLFNFGKCSPAVPRSNEACFHPALCAFTHAARTLCS